MLFEYIDGGAYAEATLARNVADFEAIALRQRVMVDTRKLDLSTRVVGQEMAVPFGLAPVGLSGMYARRGEVQGAKAAKAVGAPFCLSTMSVCDIEEVTAKAGAPWYQLYMLKDRGYMSALIARAKSAGCPVLVFTVDLPTPGARYRDIRSGFTGAAGLEGWWLYAVDGLGHPRWLWDVWLHGRPHTLGNVAGALEGKKRVGDFLAWIARNFDRSMTWKDIDWVRGQWDGPIVMKGILDPEDAKAAVKAGAQGIIVSNHGGRQLDGVRSSIAALPRVADAVGGDVELLLDGGVRSGLDVLKALSLGAKCVLLGRAWAWALGAGGEKAVAKMLTTVRSELAVAMILTGCTEVRAAGEHLLDLS
jgi:L-lactate dehydrogenase (cytochrome)